MVVNRSLNTLILGGNLGFLRVSLNLFFQDGMIVQHILLMTRSLSLF